MLMSYSFHSPRGGPLATLPSKQGLKLKVLPAETCKDYGCLLLHFHQNKD